MTAFISEIIGTAVLVLLGNGVVANVVLNKTKGNGSGWIVITTAWALAVYVGVVISGKPSGAHLNPAVSIGLAAAGKFSWGLVPEYILGQMLGALLGAFLVWLVYKDHYKETPDAGAKQATFCTAPAIRNNFSNLISEFIGTFVLLFTIFYFTDPSFAGKETGETTIIGMGSIGALPVAFLVWVIGLSLGGTTGYAINPARDLGPRIMHALLPIPGKGPNGWDYAWIPVIGPILGALAAAGLYFVLQS